MTPIRWAGVAAVLFAVFFVASMVLANDFPDGDASDQEWINKLNDSGDQVQAIVAVYLMTVASVGLVALATLLFDGGALARVARGFAYLAAAVFAIGRLALSATPAGVRIDSSPPDPGVARFLTSMGFGTILVIGALCAAAMIASISAHWMRTKEMAAWVSWLGYVCAVILLAAIIFIPVIVLPLWALIVGIVLLTRGERTAPATVPAT